MTEKEFKDDRMESQFQNTIINFGPQHPSAHGVLRLMLELDGELIKRADPHIGLLHRGTEKLMETKTYLQNIPYLDRLDYVSPLAYEHAWVATVEKLLEIQAPIRAQYIRTLFDELTRIGKHIFTMGACAMDAGAMPILLWGTEQRERLCEFYEAVSGARFHCNYYRVGGVAKDMPSGLDDIIAKWLETLPAAIDDCVNIVIKNRIFMQRTVDICKVSSEEALSMGWTGPNLRASGVAWDLRKSQPYAAYDKVDFDVYVGKNGDSYDRFYIRAKEIFESIKIIKQCLKDMPKGEVRVDNNKISPPKRADMKQSMESMIHHFKLYSEGFSIPKGEAYSAIETPSGEFGVYIVSEGLNKPYRAHLRATGFAHLQALQHILPGHQLADLPPTLGGLDVVFGEIDR